MCSKCSFHRFPRATCSRPNAPWLCSAAAAEVSDFQATISRPQRAIDCDTSMTQWVLLTKLYSDIVPLVDLLCDWEVKLALNIDHRSADQLKHIVSLF